MTPSHGRGRVKRTRQRDNARLPGPPIVARSRFIPTFSSHRRRSPRWMSGRSERLFLYLRPDAREPESISGRNISTVMRVPDDESPEALLPLQPAAFHILVALAETDRHGYAIMQE